MKVQKVWTFVICGASPFTLVIPNNPKLEHVSGMTLWKFVGTAEAVGAVQTLLQDTGASIEVHTEEQTMEQTRIRKERLHPQSTGE